MTETTRRTSTDSQGPVPSPDGAGGAWRDVGRPAEERVADLLARMTLGEKVAQLHSVWLSSGTLDGAVAPHQDDLDDLPVDWPGMLSNGLGQLTRPYGTKPVTPRAGADELARLQGQIVAANRFGIPAMTHDECLAGLAAWTATIYPVPLAWGASFDPQLVQDMAAQIGAVMRTLGIHQGLAPVLDVTIDPRWGRTEETIGEDPYLVATIGTAYVTGLESAGIVATLKHFAGYSTSRAGRNLAPATVSPRMLAERLFPPFEMAIRLGRPRSVMHAYTDIDGVPSAADATLLTDVLRGEWDFAGTVVADYFGISFLELLHGVAADAADAARQALQAGVDVELPSVRCFGPPLVDAVRGGVVDESLVDRAARRVLLQKCELGLLDPDWDPVPPVLRKAAGGAVIDLDPPPARALARRLADESIVLLHNDGVLPLTGTPRIAVIGPRADDPLAMVGCYSFPSHVGVHYPDLEVGVAIPTVLEALRAELAGSEIRYAQGCPVSEPDRSGIAEAAALAAGSDVCVAVVGDRSGLFGRGTSGEGCDAEDLRLPGVQGDLLDALLATGVPVIVVLLSGRPYALGSVASAAAIVQAFFPGEEGGPAVAAVLSGAVNPSGRLPVSVPASVGGQPSTYLGGQLAQRSTVSSIDPTPLFPFGHGVSYTSFAWEGFSYQDAAGNAAAGPARVPTGGVLRLGVTVRNSGNRTGAEVVQVYLHDPVAQVVRPTQALVAYARVEVPAGQRRRVEFEVHTDLLSFVGRRGERIVEAGRVELRVGPSSGHTQFVAPFELTGADRVIVGERTMVARVQVSDLPSGEQPDGAVRHRPDER